MENEPVRKPRPAFDPSALDELEQRKLLEEELKYLEQQRLVEGGEADTHKDPDIPPGLLNNLLEDTNPQAQ